MIIFEYDTSLVDLWDCPGLMEVHGTLPICLGSMSLVEVNWSKSSTGFARTGFRDTRPWRDRGRVPRYDTCLVDL